MNGVSTSTGSKERDIKMLVLSREESQKIRIGGNVVVTVVRCGANKVRLGIDAPPDVRVDREEVAQRIEREGPREPHPKGRAA